jgi:scpA/B protein
MALEVKLEVFEGPLDLLLHLIDKNKVNIYDIPIVLITDQYIEYIDNMEKSDLNLVSEFLVMAAMLLDIKSKMLLPKDPDVAEDDDSDPRQDLVEKLLEYKMYKYMSYELKDRQIEAENSFYKAPDIPEEILSYVPPVDTRELMTGITLQRLREIFNEVIRRQENKVDPIRSKFGKIEKEEVNMEEKMEFVHSYIKTHKTFLFRQLLSESKSRTQVIVTFLVILELIKGGKISVTQENRTDDILINSLEVG